MAAAPPVAAPAYLDDADDFYRPCDVLAVGVVHNPTLTSRERVEACRAYFRRWGAAALRRALREAERIAPLPPELVDVAGAVAA